MIKQALNLAALSGLLTCTACGGAGSSHKEIEPSSQMPDSLRNSETVDSLALSDSMPADITALYGTNKTYVDENGITHSYYRFYNDHHVVGKYNISVVSEENMDELEYEIYWSDTLARYAGKTEVIKIDYAVNEIEHRTDSFRISRRHIVDIFRLDTIYNVSRMSFGLNFKEMRNDTLVFDGGSYIRDSDVGITYELKYIDGNYEIVEYYPPEENDSL